MPHVREQVLGADTPIGQRVALSLAINGARLALLGRSDDKDTMEQVARRAACLGSPSVDIHELDLASAQQPAGGSQSSEQTPPNENLHMAVETVLSRQGHVDIIVSCPLGPSKEASVQQRNSQQLTATKTILDLLATTILAPPGSAHCAVINIMHSSNSEMLQWARDLPQHMAAAAAKDLTGLSGPTAVDMSPEQRLAAAQGVFMARLLLADEAQEESHDTPETCRAVAAALLEALTAWRSPHQQQQQQQPGPKPHSMEIHVSPSHVQSLQTDSPGPEKAPAGLTGLVKGAAHKAMHPMSSSSTHNAADSAAVAATRGAEAPASAAAAAHGSRQTSAAAAGILQGLVRMSLQGSSTSSSEGAEKQQQQQQQQQQQRQGGTGASGSASSAAAAAAAAAVSGVGGSSAAGVLLGVGQEELLIDQLEGLLGPAAAAAAVDSEAAEEELLIQQLVGLLGPAAAALNGDSEASKVTGRNPCPRPGATHAAEPSSAVWIRSETPPVTGILLATGSRNPPGLLSRPRFGPSELLKAAGALPGAVLTPADPHNLEPEAGKAYQGDPQRHPSYLVHCFKPFNGETPHQLLSDAWLTPAALFYVRNHLPVPTQLKAEAYR
uniref:NAD(P)-binding domain-containing protein n=1 Tax=Tetradesmus obliquus TaxID=3088 RepID=A0A383W333_TETOB|eukprot:jgi/Sobl393_1/4724/SZX71549.1